MEDERPTDQQNVENDTSLSTEKATDVETIVEILVEPNSVSYTVQQTEESGPAIGEDDARVGLTDAEMETQGVGKGSNNSDSTDESISRSEQDSLNMPALIMSEDKDSIEKREDASVDNVHLPEPEQRSVMAEVDQSKNLDEDQGSDEVRRDHSEVEAIDDESDNEDDQDMNDDSHEAVDGECDEEAEDIRGDESDDEDVETDLDDYDSNEDEEEAASLDDSGEAEMDARAARDDDDDVAVISDTSDEEREIEEAEEDVRSDQDSLFLSRRIYDSDEVESESEVDDDDDLMNSILMPQRTEKDRMRELQELMQQKQPDQRSKIARTMKRRTGCDWRLKLKKRSLKWLKTVRMRNVSESQDVNISDYIVSDETSTPKKSHTISDSTSLFVISHITSIADEKDPINISDSSPDQYNENFTEMQQINKIQDYIKKPTQEEQDDIKPDSANQNGESTSPMSIDVDENNKENIGNNDKSEASLPKSNGTTCDASSSNKAVHSNSNNKEVVDVSESDDMEVMEISDEPSYEYIEETIIDTKQKKQTEIECKQSDECDKKEELPLEPREFSKMMTDVEIKDEQHKKCNEEAEIKTEKDIVATINQQLSNTTVDPPKTVSPPISNAVTTSTDAPTSSSIQTGATKTHTSASAKELIPQSEPAAKRPRTPSTVEDQAVPEDIPPAKKLKLQLDSNFHTHDRILNEYIERTSNNSIDEIQKHLEQLITEIQTLNDMIKTKELEWNNLLHLKKVKEEICVRLTRKKQVLEIMSTKIGQVNDGSGDGFTVPAFMENFNSISADMHGKIRSNAISAATGTPTTNSLAAASTPLAMSKTTLAVSKSSTPNNAAFDASSAHANATLLNNLNNVSAISVNSSQLQQQESQNVTTSSTGGSLVQNILQNRVNMKSSDLVKEKATTQRLHRILVSRNILPKPATVPGGASGASATNGDYNAASVGLSLLSKVSHAVTATPLNASTNMSIPSLSFGGANVPMNLTSSNSAQKSFDTEQQPILNNYLKAKATIQRQLGEMMNGHHNLRISQDGNGIANSHSTVGIGRQGALKDVKSLIADYRQKHPEVVPRRGRRVKTSSLANLNQLESSNMFGNVLRSDGKGPTDFGSLLARIDGNSRPSSNDSSHSLTNPLSGNMQGGNVSFKDVLIQFAKLNEQNSMERPPASMNAKTGGGHTSNQPFPEVTLHPVTSMHSSLEQQGAGSLLHGILTKFNRPNVSSTVAPVSSSTTTTANYNSSFSPTLARLLTAPDRMSSAAHSLHPSYQQASSNALNISKMVSGQNSEITITPVVSAQQVPTLLQQQLEQQQISMKRDRIKLENLLNAKEDEADDSVDRLVIDEGGDSSTGADDNLRIAPNAYGLEFNENEVPACQGCKKNEAQFVCAGCANQLYCSRECQVAAWDEHSEVCTG